MTYLQWTLSVEAFIADITAKRFLKHNLDNKFHRHHIHDPTRLTLPVCIRAWRFSCSIPTNFFSQTSHSCFRSPICERLCMIRLLEYRKSLPQWSQRCGFSPEWMSMCFYKRNSLITSAVLTAPEKEREWTVPCSHSSVSCPCHICCTRTVSRYKRFVKFVK